MYVVKCRYLTSKITQRQGGGGVGWGDMPADGGQVKPTFQSSQCLRMQGVRDAHSQACWWWTGRVLSHWVGQPFNGLVKTQGLNNLYK